jgi:DNA-binding CsgD family transcriptional regulator
MLIASGEQLLEREEALAELGEIVGESVRGRGRLVVVEGPAGIGKTRLLEAVGADCEPAGHAVLRARGSELEREFAFGVVRQLFEPLAAPAGGPPPADVFSGAAALSLPLLTGSVAPDEAAEPAPATDPVLPLLHGLYWLVANLAREQPVALLVDDAHWADLPSLRFVSFLGSRLDELAVLAVVAVRAPEPGTPELVQRLADDAAIVRPSALSEEAVATLLRAELGERTRAELSRACHRATGGNPFLTRELIRELAMAGADPAVAALELGEVRPRSVSRSVLLRIGRLAPAAGRLARTLAVLGDGADLRLSAEHAELDPDEATSAAAALVEAGILADASPLRFLHPIIRTAVYADITEPERAREHERAAALLRARGAPQERVAVHLLVTAPGGDAGVVETLRDAARVALSRGATDTAAAFLRRALAEPPAGDQRLELLRELGTVEVRLGEPESGLEHLREAHERTSSPKDRTLAALDLALALTATQRTQEAIELLERAAPEAMAADRELGLRLEAELMSTAAFDLEMAPRLLPRAERVAQGLRGETPSERLLLAALSFPKQHEGKSAAAAADLAHAALAGGLLDEQGSEAIPVTHAIFALIVAERHDEAAAFVDAAIADARRRGSPLAFAMGSQLRAQLHFRLSGQMREAEADARAAMDIRFGGLPIPTAMAFLVLSLLEQGEVDAASAVFDEFGMQSEPIFEHLLSNVLVFARARLRFAQGRNEECLADLRDLERREDKWQVGAPQYPWRSTAALVLARLGRKEDADDVVAEELRRYRIWGVPGPIGVALRTRGLLEGGESGIETLRESVEVLRGSAARLELAKSLAELGAALRRANRRSESRAPLREGLDLADRCGATALARRARDELAATGARPRKEMLTGAASLTASERRICEMAASGMSNPEIAQALFVTIKNVEGHLTHAYRKLDIGSRRELAEALS